MTGPDHNIEALTRVAFLTVGCRANQADTSRMISALPAGFSEADIESDRCDIVVVNTCAVTARAEADCRKLIRRARRKHPLASIIVVGCASQVRPEAWEGMPEVDRVYGLVDFNDLRKYINEPSPTRQAMLGSSCGVSGPTPLHGHRSRPFLKIQDGCSRGCTYCIVPKARGPERSRPAEQVRQDIVLLSENGFREIVLTGIHLGRWGYDLGVDFGHLLDTLEKISADVRLRLSSIEPMDLSPDLVRRILTHPLLCPHLHMPLQSGDDRLLSAMGRGHTSEEYAGLVKAAVETNPDVAIGTDILVGFPGEDDEAFRNSLEFVSRLPFAYLHVFTFSPRMSTPAFDMTGRPSGEAVKERMRLLKEVDRVKRSAFQRAFHGRILPCLIESPGDAPETLRALSHNYLRLRLSGPPEGLLPGQVLPLVIDTNNDSHDGMPTGRLVNP